ncbi:MAG: LicD family protein [Clostridia bacterium]|nr:LicD family protein [Clostridia bacterium]
MKINITQIQKIENEMLKETIEILNRNDIIFYMCCGSVLGTIRHSGPIPWDTDMDILVPFSMLEKARNCLEAELSDRFRIDDLKNNANYTNLFPRVAMPNTSSNTLHIDLFPLIGLPDNKDEQLKICKILTKRQQTFIRYKRMRECISNPNAVKLFIARIIEIFCSPFSKKELTRQYHKIMAKYPYDSANYVMNACGHYGVKNIFEKTVFGAPKWKPYCDFKVPIPEQWDFYLKRYYKEYMNLPPKEERDKWLSYEMEIDDSDFEKIKCSI